MFYEKFASQAALDQHLTAPYFKRFRITSRRTTRSLPKR
jgi:quinol monooxygenase YgiN